MLQSMSPVVILEMSNHHGGEKMACCTDGDCNGASCPLDGTKSCSCNHAASTNASDNTKLCGCNHHGNEPLGINAPFQIKAPLVSAFDDITFSPTFIFLNLKEHYLFIFTDDIFYPPRLNA